MRSQCTLHRPINVSITKQAYSRSKSRILRRKCERSFVTVYILFTLLRASESHLVRHSSQARLGALGGTLVISGP